MRHFFIPLVTATGLHLLANLPAHAQEVHRLSTSASDLTTETSDLNHPSQFASGSANSTPTFNAGGFGQSSPLFHSSTTLNAAPMAQVTGVNQLRDVAPSDWAYQALSDLISRYNCIAGYPDGTFRGNRSLSRYEFAAGLNACLQAMERLIAEVDGVPTETLAVMEQLMAEFTTELANLGQRVDGLESRVSFLEDNQFSTTTKLFGQVVAGLQGRLDSQSDLLAPLPLLNNLPFIGRDGIAETSDRANELNFGYNAQLSLMTTFSPRTRLLTGLAGGNLSTRDLTLFGFNNSFTTLGYEFNSGSSLILTDVNVRHLLTDRLAVIAGPRGVNPVNVFRGPSRVESAGFGPISRFAQRNPVIQLGSPSGGAGLDWQVGRRASVQAVYSAFDSGNPALGLVGNAYTAGVQVLLTPTETVDTALYYLHSYGGALGGFLATGSGDDQIGAIADGRFTTHGVGATLNWQVSPKVTLGTWGGWTRSNAVATGTSGGVETVNWMFSAQFPDLFKEGNLGAIFFGQPPRITGSNLRQNGVLTGNVPSLFAGSLGATNEGRGDRSLHLEAFYRWQLTPNISLTPGIISIFNPNHTASSDTIWIGALRTTLTF